MEIFANLFSKCFAKPKIKIIMYGLCDSGKTAILNRIKLNEFTWNTIPTVGVNTENIMYKGFELVILDIGDTGERLRPLWRHYYKGTQGFIYVVNSVETCRIDEAREVLNEHFLEKIEMPNPILHIYPNKQDLPNSHPPSEIGELLQLNAIQGLIWKVQGASAKTGDGVFEGLDWLIEQVKIRGIYDI